jgi:hypothetical protein
MAYYPPAYAQIPGGYNPSPTQIAFGDPKPFGSMGIQSALLGNIGYHHAEATPYATTPMPPGGRGNLDTFANLFNPAATRNLRLESFPAIAHFDQALLDDATKALDRGDVLWQFRPKDAQLAMSTPRQWASSSAAYGSFAQGPSRAYFNTAQVNLRLRIWQLWKLTQAALDFKRARVADPTLDPPTVYETLGGARGVMKSTEFDLTGVLLHRTLRGSALAQPGSQKATLDLNILRRGIFNLRNYYAMSYTEGANFDYALLPYRKDWKTAFPGDDTNEARGLLHVELRSQKAYPGGAIQVANNLVYSSVSGAKVNIDYAAIQEVFGNGAASFVMYQVVPVVIDEVAFSLCEDHPVIDYLTCDSDDPTVDTADSFAKTIKPADLCAFHVGRVSLSYRWDRNDVMTPTSVVASNYTGDSTAWQAVNSRSLAETKQPAYLQEFFMGVDRGMWLAGATSAAVVTNAKEVHTRIDVDMSSTTDRQYRNFNMLKA